MKKSIADLEDELDQLKRMHNKDSVDLQTQRDEYENKLGIMQLDHKQEVESLQSELDSKDKEYRDMKKIYNDMSTEYENIRKDYDTLLDSLQILFPNETSSRVIKFKTNSLKEYLIALPKSIETIINMIV